MAYDVHLHVSFACDTNDGVAALAKKHLAAGYELETEAKWFLSDLSERTGANNGPKGGLSLWGVVGNYTRPDEFVSCLAPFWTELLASEIDGGPLDFERVIVFSEAEQSERATAHEIWQEGGELRIAKHELPFAWMQY